MPGKAYDAVWGRAFASVYDAAFVLAERRGLREVRRDLLGRASGRVLELGAGTGLNLEHYTDRVRDLVLTEPDSHMAAKLHKRMGDQSVPARTLEAPAEAIPVDDASVDVVVSTLVLCTVDDPAQTLEEVHRVLRPGGVFLFAEHVRSTSQRAAYWQDKLNTSWGWYACGCHCNRNTVASIAASPLQLTEVREDRLRWISPLVRSLAVGVATRDDYTS